MISATSASSAYQAAQKILDQTEGKPQSAKPASEFQNLIKDAIETTAADLKHAEAMSMKGIAGKASVTDVVTAVSNAEIALNSMMMIRTKVIEAYQEIMRMPI